MKGSKFIYLYRHFIGELLVSCCLMPPVISMMLIRAVQASESVGNSGDKLQVVCGNKFRHSSWFGRTSCTWFGKSTGYVHSM